MHRIRTGSLPEHPIVLIGSGFWDPIHKACERSMRGRLRKTIEREELARWTVVDSAGDALSALNG